MLVLYNTKTFRQTLITREMCSVFYGKPLSIVCFKKHKNVKKFNVLCEGGRYRQNRISLTDFYKRTETKITRPSNETYQWLRIDKMRIKMCFPFIFIKYLFTFTNATEKGDANVRIVPSKYFICWCLGDICIITVLVSL